MTDSFVRLDKADASKKIDAEELLVGGLSVFRLRVSTVGGAAPGGGLTDAELRATPVPVSGSFSVTGGLTDAELRASAVPVSGPLTDAQLRLTPVPVSGTVAVNVGLTDVQLRATPIPISTTLIQALTDAQLRATPVPVSGPLTDTLLRATPVPVSGTLAVNTGLTDSQLRATPVPISGNVGVVGAVEVVNDVGNPLPVSGTVTVNLGLTDAQLRAVAVPVSGPLTDAQIRATALPVSGPLTDAALRATAVPVSGPLTDAQLRAVAVPISAPTLTKFTQGAQGFSVQPLRDAGRNTRIFMLDAYVVAPVAEAVQNVVQWYNNAAVAGTAQPAVVPAGKMLRLVGWRITYKSTAVFNSVIVRIRANVAGLGVLASPLVASFETGSQLGATTVAIVGAVSTETGTFPEGLDIPAAAGLAFSMAGYGPTGVLALSGPTRFMVYGYEF